jgi:hypothetical protein
MTHDKKWGQKLSSMKIQDQKQAFLTLEKMLKKWDIIF